MRPAGYQLEDKQNVQDSAYGVQYDEEEVDPQDKSEFNYDSCCSSLLRKKHNIENNELALKCALYICCQDKSEQPNAFNLFCLYLCCESPAKCCISIPDCVADSYWSTKNCCGFWYSVNKAVFSRSITRQQFETYRCGSCDEDVLTKYEHGGLASALNPSVQVMS